MFKAVYHKSVPENRVTDSTIHPSLRPYLLNISFQQLDTEQARKIISGDVEAILNDFVRKARNEGLLK